MDIGAKITAAAGRNRELLAILSETDHAHSELEQQKKYIAELEADINGTRKRVSSLDSKRKKELKEHESYRDSVVKRFAYKVTGKKEKFEAKASSEEQEYFQALQEESKAQEILKGLEVSKSEGLKACDGILGEVQRHDQAQRDLDALYEDIFQGPSPGFPEEDAVEERRRQADEACRAARSRSDAQDQAIRILSGAMSKMDEAMRQMQSALNHSRRDMWGGGTLTDMMERNALSRAAAASNEARMAISQAMHFDDTVQMIPEPRVPQGDIVMDVFFDNVFTDMAFHEKIKSGMREVHAAREMLSRQLDGAKARGQFLRGKVGTYQGVLEQARVDLQKERQRAFQRVTSSRNGTGTGVGHSEGGFASNNPFKV